MFRLYFIVSFFLFFLEFPTDLSAQVHVGVDVLFSEDYIGQLKNQNIGLITNQTAINGKRQSTLEILKKKAKAYNYKVTALFAPEHGLNGDVYGEEEVLDAVDPDGIPIYSLHGKTRRPTKEMLRDVDILIYDIQDIGSRSYTYVTTLFYAMEEAAKYGVKVMVLDRPNPINGLTVDGPMLEEKYRSFVGYINVPYCHGMTVGELAAYFNAEYKIKCPLTVIPMQGWFRNMTFQETGLVWIPTSPHVPEWSTALYYPTTGILGEMPIANIGIGYTLPFKLVGAPWIDAQVFASKLNSQKFPGVYFKPYYYKPFYGRFSHENLQGILVIVTDPLKFKPVTTQFLIIGLLKSLYPVKFKEAMDKLPKDRKDMVCKVCGTSQVYQLMLDSGPIAWKLRELDREEREAFLAVRKKYLIPSYSR